MINAPGHRLLIRPDNPEEVDPVYKQAKAAGIKLLDTHEDRLRERAGVDKGVVLQVGPTAFRDFGGEPWCQAGDYIAYARHAGKWVEDPDSGEALLIINDEDVVCTIIQTQKET